MPHPSRTRVYSKHGEMLVKPLKGTRKKPFKGSKKLKSIIKSVVTSQLEHKDIETQIGNASSAIAFCTNGVPVGFAPTASLYPSIVAGTANGARIGNKIKITKFIMNYVLSTAGGAANPCPLPFFVTIMCGFLKQAPSSYPSNAQWDSLYDQGAGSSDGYDSSSPFALTRLKRINTDLYHIVYNKTHKVGSSINGTAGSSVIGANNDFPLSHIVRIDLTNKLFKNLEFNNNTSNVPSNCHCFTWAYVSGSNGSLAGTYGMPEISMNTWVQYTDA